MAKGIIIVDMPENASDCIKCPMLNDNGECVLQSDDQNKIAKTWEGLQSECPIKPLSKETEMQLFKEGKL